MGELLNSILPNISPVACYIIVGLVIGLESIGIPLPGEIILIGAVLLTFKHPTLQIYLIGISGSIGAIIGDNIGYFIGMRWGKILLGKMGEKFPQHCGVDRIEKVEVLFHKYGVWAIFFGRFAALLRVLSGPVSGVLHIPYWKFLLANISGAIVWVGSVICLVSLLGKAAERLLTRSSWTLLGIATIIALIIWWKIRINQRHNSSHSHESIDN